MAILSADNLFRSLLPTQQVYKDAVTGEAAGVLHSSLYLTGSPGAGAAPSPGMAGAALTSYAGQIPFPAAVASKNVYLARLILSQGGSVGAISIYDRLWHQSGIVVTTTTGQTINSVAFPARDLDGSVNGRGVQVGIEVSTVTGNGGAISNTTLTYTNSLGSSGKTATIASFPATGVAGSLVPFSLAAGDVGVQSIQTVTLGTSYVSGTIHLVAFREIATIPLPTANVAGVFDALQLGLPRMFDNSVPWMVYLPTGTAIGTVAGSLVYAQG